MVKYDIEKLNKKAMELRKNVVEMVYRAQSGHIGGSLSIAEIITVLYYEIMKCDSEKPNLEDRDRLVLSKGHSSPILYVALADKGYFNKKLLFDSYRRVGGVLQGHPDMNKTPGIDMTTGSLGIGLSVACGMALGAKIQNKNIFVYTIMGDGEINEGQIWEAAATAAHYKLDNLIGIVDVNGLQNDGLTKDVLRMDSLNDKWKSFGWKVIEIDGHDIDKIINALIISKTNKDRPTVILCKTVKGKGVSFMENSIKFHGASPNKEEYKIAIDELNLD